MSEQLNTINERLKHLRKNVLRLTQSELGNTLGLGKAAVSKMESNTSTITEQNIKLICKEFNKKYVVIPGPAVLFRKCVQILQKFFDFISRSIDACII